MEEKEVISPISEEEAHDVFARMAAEKMRERAKVFRDTGMLFLMTYQAVGRFRSIRRAIRRGHVSLSGVIYPRRPFNNKKRGPGTITYERRKVHEQFRGNQ